ncbi:MAG TPA: hypothetical protein VLA32_11185 [Anaerolineales bacterium]|nr:hypothetical protein [Anaerolineales bacterium]
MKKMQSLILNHVLLIYPTRRLHHAILFTTALLICISFLWGLPNAVPMGDSYIHFTYARNLVVHGELSFIPGMSNEGIGSSSILWVIILAVFQWLGVSPVIATKILGISFLSVSGILFFELCLKICPDLPEPRKYLIASTFSLAAVFSGSLIWLTLSGMETILFLTLGLLSLWLYAQESWVLTGVSLGLLALTRIEGILFAGVLVLFELIRSRRIDSKIIKMLVALFVLLLPWLIYLQIREGVPVSNSLDGRQYVVSEVDKRIASEFSVFFWMAKVNPLVHIATWTYYTLIYLTGVLSLPGPVLYLGGSLVGTELIVPVIGILIGVVCLYLLVLSLKCYIGYLKTSHFDSPHIRLQMIVIALVITFNLAYALYLPRPGAGGRYLPMNHLLFWVCLVSGGLLIKHRKTKAAVLLLIVLLYGINMNYWRDVYRLNVEYLVKVRKGAALYIDEELPADSAIGATDLGALGYFARQPVVDLFGHISKEFKQFRADGGSHADYLDQKNLCYLMLFGSVDGYGLDFRQEMDLYGDPRFNLVVEKSFSVPIEDWKLGSGPLRNYMPKMNVYRVIWQDKSRCR